MYRVLLVSSERIIRDALAKAVDWESLSAEVIAAVRTGQDACRACSFSMPDLVITDLTLPGMSCLEFVHRLYCRDMNVKFLILSGYGETELAEKAVHLGASAYLEKPVSKESLENAVQSLLLEIEENNHRYKLLINSGITYARGLLPELLENGDPSLLLRPVSADLRNHPEGLGLVISAKPENLPTLKDLGRQITSLFPFIIAGDKLYGLFYVSQLPRLDKKLAVAFQGKPDEAARMFVRRLALARKLLIFSLDGHEAEFPNDESYLRRIAMLENNLHLAEKAGTDIRPIISCLSQEEAKDVFLRFVLKREKAGNSLFYSAAKLLDTAKSAEELADFLLALHHHPSTVDKQNYPAKELKRYLENEEKPALKQFMEEYLPMSEAYLCEFLTEAAGESFELLAKN